ncbi:MAG: 3-deoxy-7-phosphoheptulonate synthase [Verrucomicrobia subdivision 3 bacterium]|nr:3-deoxy-7-phosphoheptulonate synthase [Limisphaerales bacterium]
MQPTQDLRVIGTQRLRPPRLLKEKLPVSEAANQTVVNGRAAVQRILRRQDPRLLLIIGPCSAHDPAGALDYASRLLQLSRELRDQIFVVMRVYFEKPRTTVGWKGLINDPHLDGSCDIEDGLRIARKLLIDINELGLPVGTEFLDPIVPQYIAELVTWTAIGARTTESQTHREMASGLSMPVGFKNGTDGSLQIAIDAMSAASSPHSFLGIDQDGFTTIIRTAGNPDTHVVLRGGRTRPNYDPQSIAEASAQLLKHNLPNALMVDCSHANSGKQHARQEEVWMSLIQQRADGNPAIFGAMIESYLKEGNQPMPKNPADIAYGISLTDACISWETTERILRYGHRILSEGSGVTPVRVGDKQRED